jgi:hypothetical protein
MASLVASSGSGKLGFLWKVKQENDVTSLRGGKVVGMVTPLYANIPKSPMAALFQNKQYDFCSKK